MKSPSEQKNASEKPKIIDLPSGAKAERSRFKGKHVKEAIRAADGDQSLVMFAMIAASTLIDGKRLTLEEIEELDGMDVLALMADFNGLFS